VINPTNGLAFTSRGGLDHEYALFANRASVTDHAVLANAATQREIQQ
jgi:hypothetical protein